MKLAAILFVRQRESHAMIKLFESGTTAPVRTGGEAEAIEWAQANRYKCDGAWLHNAPALVWSPSWLHFEAAWGRPALRAPVRFARSGQGVAVGDAGRMVTSRRREDIVRLRQEYPYLGSGDISMIPVSKLARRNDQARRRLERQTRALVGRDHSNLVAIAVQ